jgi:hypothetical protein
MSATPGYQRFATSPLYGGGGGGQTLGTTGAYAMGIGTALSAFSTFLAGKMQSDTNVANINAQTTAYNQMAEYAKQNMGLIALNKENYGYERNSLLQQGMQARNTAARQGAMIRGGYRAAQADSGVAMSGSKQDLLDQIDADNFASKRNLDLNIASAYMSHTLAYRQTIFGNKQSYNAGIQQYQNQINEYNNRMGSVPIASLQGAIGGMSTGINIASGVRGLYR